MTLQVHPVVARPLLLGHRGARAYKSIPENTIASFDRALQDGCDGFEFDVRMTADGEAVVCHDPVCRDATGRSLEIARTNIDVLSDLPRLDEVFKRYHRAAFLDIELKVDGLEEKVSELLRRYGILCGFVVSSFFPGVLRSLREADPRIPLGLICETRAQLEAWRELPVDYVIARYGLAGQRLIREIQDSGMKVFVWTVNRPATMKKFAGWGVQGVLSDDTRMLKRILSDPRGRGDWV